MGLLNKKYIYIYILEISKATTKCYNIFTTQLSLVETWILFYLILFRRMES